jgi:hypothetical protein
MHYTYPLNFETISSKLDEYTELNLGESSLEFNMSSEDQLMAYRLYNTAFGVIAKINPFFSKLVRYYSQCIIDGNVLTILPVKGVKNFELIYDGRPTQFVIVMPFCESMRVLTQSKVCDVAISLIYELIFIDLVLGYNSGARANDFPFLDLSNSLVQLQYNYARQVKFKLFWNGIRQDGKFSCLPKHLKQMMDEE